MTPETPPSSRGRLPALSTVNTATPVRHYIAIIMIKIAFIPFYIFGTLKILQLISYFSYSQWHNKYYRQIRVVRKRVHAGLDQSEKSDNSVVCVWIGAKKL